MADTKTSKIILSYQVQGDSEAIDSVGRIQAGINNTTKAVQTLHDALVDLTVRDEAERLGQEFGEDVAKGILTADEAAEKLADSLAKIGANTADIKAAASAFQDFKAGQDDSGGGFSGASGLRRTGGALSQLGLGEAGRGVSIAGDIVQLGKFKDTVSQLSPSVIAAGVGIGAFTVALDLYTKAQEQAKQAALAEIDARQKALTLLQTGSQQEIQTRINQLAQEKSVNEATAADANKLFGDLREGVKTQLGGVALAAEDVAATTGKAAGSFQAAHDAADKANDSVNKTSTELNILTTSSGLAAQGINEVGQSLQNAAFIAGQVTNQNAADLESYKAANFGTSKALQDRIRELQLELAVTGNSIAAGEDKVKQLGAETEAGQAAQKSVDALITSYNATGTTLEALSKSFVAVDIAAREAADNITEASKDASDAIIKYNDEMTKNDEEAKKAQADIQQKYNDALVKAADANATAIENAYNKLQDTTGKLTTDFDRNNDAAARKAQEDAQTRQIHFQQDEAKAARDHANELLKIQQDEQNKEQDLIANRDFAGLFRARRDVTTQIQQSNTQYQQQEADRQTAYAQQNADAARQYIFEANERKIKYQQANDDAKTQYNKDLAAANAAEIKANQQAVKARDEQIKIEADKYKAQYDLLNRSIQNELLLYKAGQTNRAQVIANEQAALTQSVALLAGTFRAALQFPTGNTTNNVGNNNNSNNNFTFNGGGPANRSQGIAKQVYSILNEIIK